MKYVFSGLMLAALALFAACGSTSGNSNANVTGNWSASLVDANSNPYLTFTTSLMQNSNGSISSESLTFTTNSACFPNGGTETGSFTVSGNTSGATSGGVQLSIVSTGASNTLTLNGTFQNNTVNGTWTLNGGTGCSGNGTFTMTKVS